MNRITLLGRLTKTVETKYTQDNKTIAKFSIAVNRRFAGKDGERQADFFDVVAFGKTAEFITNYFKKGQQVVISGRLQNNNYEDKNGVKHYSNIIVAEEVYFADSKKEESKPSETFNDYDFSDVASSDLPF